MNHIRYVFTWPIGKTHTHIMDNRNRRRSLIVKVSNVFLGVVLVPRLVTRPMNIVLPRVSPGIGELYESNR